MISSNIAFSFSFPWIHVLDLKILYLERSENLFQNASEVMEAPRMPDISKIIDNLAKLPTENLLILVALAAMALAAFAIYAVHSIASKKGRRLMPLTEWVRLPTAWIENNGLRHFRWGASGSDHIAALMSLMAIAHHGFESSKSISRPEET